MSARNKRSAKAARRQQRARQDQVSDTDLKAGALDDLVQVQSYDEFVGLAERGETLPCGCDAHQLLHSGGWRTLDELDD